jgi:hypothetical protein
VVVLPSAGQATEVKIENYSNGSIWVVVAHKRGKAVSSGWYEIPMNQTQTFSAADDEEMYLRIQDDDDKEITFPGRTKFHHFPLNVNDGFDVTTPRDDADILMLKWGDKREKMRNVKRKDPLPDGWKEDRFFEVGPGKQKLEVKP